MRIANFINKVSTCLLLVSYVFSFGVSFGQSNSIAFAFPSPPIVVDGNLNEWPKNSRSYPIQLVYGNNPPTSTHDISASFKVAYNIEQQALYVAVEVEDDFHLTNESQNVSWATQDSHILYLDVGHSPEHSGIISYLYSKDYQTIFQKENSWDPLVVNSSWNNVRVKSARIGNKTTYEWAIYLDNHIYPNKSIGLDHMLIDRDEGDKENKLTIISWGKGDPKHTMSGFLGDLILLESDQQLSILSGQISWETNNSRKLPGKINLQSIKHQNLWVSTAPNEIGQFKIELPSGMYKVYPSDNFINFTDGISVRVDHSKNLIIDSDIASSNSNQLELQALELKKNRFKEGWLFSFNDGHISDVDKTIKYLMNYYTVPGVSLSIITGDNILYHKIYGFRNGYTKEPVEANTLFEAASITKPLFGYCVLKLVEKGVIELDKPLHEYFPIEGIEDKRHELITARHILSHKSGLPNFGKQIIFTPGTKYGYSGEAIDYLREVIEFITQKDIETVISEEVLEPLNLNHIYFKNNQYVKEHTSFGHIGSSPTLLTIPGEPNMAFSMFTEAKTFAQFIIELVQRKNLDSRLFEQYFAEETLIPKDKSTGLGVKEYFGLGIHMVETPYGKMFGHGGNNGDFQCQFEFYKEKNIGFIIYTNSDNGMKLINSFRNYCILGK